MPLPLKLILLLVGWILLANLAYQAGFDAFSKTLLQMEFVQALTGLTIILFSLLVRGLRWSVIFGETCGNINALRYYIANLSYVTFTPLRSGDFFIMPLLKSRWNISYQTSTSRLLIEKMIDILVIALCTLPFLIFQDWVERYIVIWATLAVTLLAIIFGTLLFRSKYRDALSGATVTRCLLLFTLSFIAFGLEIVGGFILIDALFTIKLIDYSILKPASILFGIVTLIPGGMGVESYTLNELFKWRGIDSPHLVSTIVTVKLITMTTIVLLGQAVLFWSRSGGSPSEITSLDNSPDAPAKPRITVLIPNFNGGHFLGKALQSLTQQTYRHFQVHIVDDGSHDDSLAIAEKMVEQISEQLPTVKIDRLSNVGITANWNRAISKVDTEFFALLHCDDEYEPHYLECMLSLLDRHPEAAIAHCPAIAIDEHSNPINSPIESYKYLRYFRSEESCLSPAETFRLLLSGDYINCPSVLFRASAAKKIGAFNEQFQQVQDWEYWFRTALCGYSTASMNRRLMRYRRHQGNLSHTNAKQLIRYREEFGLLEWAWQQGEAKAWIKEKPHFDIVTKTAIFDMVEDLANGRSDDAEEKRSELMALMPSFRRSYLYAIVLLFSRFGTMGGKTLRLSIRVYVSLTCLYYSISIVKK